MADSRITTTLDVRYVGQPALTEMERSFVTATDNIEDLAKGMEKGKKEARKFSMELLGIGFFGKMVSKQLGFLNQELKDMYFTGELLNIQFSMIAAAAPFWDMFADAMYGLADAFYLLPEPVQGFFGVLLPLVSTIAGAIGNLGFFALGLEQIGILLAPGSNLLLGAGNLLTYLIAFSTPILILIGILAALWLAWQTNFANIRQFADDVWKAIEQGIEGIRRVIEGVMDIIVGIFTGDWEKIKEGIKKILDGIWQFFVNFIGNFVLSAVKFGIRVIDAFRKWLFEDLPRLFKDALDDVWGKIVTFFDDLTGGAFSRGVAFVQSLIKGITSIASQVATALWNLIPEPFKGWLKAGIDLATGVINALTGGYQETVKWANTPTTVTAPTPTINFPTSSYLGAGTIQTPTGGMSVAENLQGTIPTSITLSPTISVDASVSSSYDAKNIGKDILDGMYSELRRRRI